MAIEVISKVEHKCDRCEGLGHISMWTLSHSKGQRFDVQCPECGGSGKGCTVMVIGWRAKQEVSDE